jgi:arylformamidase
MATAITLSPGLQSNRHLPPCLLVWGENETAEFKRQSQVYASFLKMDGVLAACQEISERNHFDVVYELPSLLQQQGRLLGLHH